MNRILSFFLLLVTINGFCQKVEKKLVINNRYLNYPVQRDIDRQRMCIVSGADTLVYSDIRIADSRIDYWVFTDVGSFKGKAVKLVFDEPADGINKIYQSDEINGADSLYSEANRPQFHFTTKRGWNNDPNGLVYENGEYHLFYQHNPYGIKWGNMHWGHAVSKDLVHWEEIKDVLYPDHLGTMFSGSAVIDATNTSGWGKNVLVVAYTTAGARQTQCIAYRKDHGRTFTKYEGNPVIDSREKWSNPNTRDPKVFWYAPNNEWVMVLFEANGNSIYTSKNLKKWQYESHVTGFWECPELFELPVDGNNQNTVWVMYGASGTYMTGKFNGKVFTPEGGKYRTVYGNQYAAQTYNNVPDGRRIQIGWGRIEQKGMPFNQMMTFPTELSLHTTNEGVRLFCKPVTEIEKLHGREYQWENLSLAEANERLKEVRGRLLHLKFTVEIPNGVWYTLYYKGNAIVSFDGNQDLMNTYQYISDQPGKYVFNVEVLLDRTTVEAFFENGKMVTVAPLNDPKSEGGLRFDAAEHTLIIHNLEIRELSSIWKE